MIPMPNPTSSKFIPMPVKPPCQAKVTISVSSNGVSSSVDLTSEFLPPGINIPGLLRHIVTLLRNDARERLGIPD